tara:strand:+ start:584 stop:976 length:393 start_codon:yes stop_codon:yes gene_type:complete
MPKQTGVDCFTGEIIYVGDTYYSFILEYEQCNTLFLPIFLNEQHMNDSIEGKLNIPYKRYSRVATDEDHLKYTELKKYTSTDEYYKLVTRCLMNGTIYTSIYKTIISIIKSLEDNNNYFIDDFKLLKLLN